MQHQYLLFILQFTAYISCELRNLQIKSARQGGGFSYLREAQQSRFIPEGKGS